MHVMDSASTVVSGLRNARILVLVVLFPLLVACGESEQVEHPNATALNLLELPENAAVQTVDEAIASAMASGIDDVGRDGQPIRIAETRLTRFGDIPHDSWARSDAARGDDSGDIVWEVELENLWLGHSCMMGSPPESCHWTDLVVVIAAESGDVIGYRYPDWFLED